MLKKGILILLTFLFFCCSKDSSSAVDLSKISIELDINRFEVDFYTSEISELPMLKKKYPKFFPQSVSDSIWIAKKKDKDELELFDETLRKHNDIKGISSELILLLKHVKYYFPDYQIPSKITTVISNIDYNYRVILGQNEIVISLDAYLGKDHRFYADYPEYIRENNEPEAIVVDAASAIINTLIPPSNDRTFLGKMIYEGKKKYVLDALLPSTSEKYKSRYSERKLNWAKNNEEEVWQYFIEKDLLYSTDSDLDKRFLELAPFSKFYLQLDNDTPGQIGVWMGWQIVSSFMDNNDVSLRSLISTPEQKIFKQSNYKPRN